MSRSQRPLPEHTQHSQETDIHVPGVIQTHNPSKRAVTDPLLNPTATGIANTPTADTKGKLTAFFMSFSGTVKC